MKHYVICDKRADFIHDVKMRALLDEQDIGREVRPFRINS